ncbi:MAG: molybdopterin-dependent oxidoreductase [Chloroflexota bacterium]
MSDKNISRRDFLKIAGVGAATSAVLTGCGPASRYVTREPYAEMPEYTYNGQSTFYATTCMECAAACGLVVRTVQGRAIKVEGNPNHPVNLGKTCARAQASLQGLYNPDRVQFPVKQARGETLSTEQLSWDEAVGVVGEALGSSAADGLSFLIGETPDHLYDVISELTTEIGAAQPVRYGALSLFEARATLKKAAENVFGQAEIPYFDLAGADLTFSFGANFLETWLSPVANTRGYAQMRQGAVNGGRGTLVQFEPRMSMTASKADEWVPIKPGTESLVALAIGRLAAELKGGALPPVYQNVSAAGLAEAAGVSLEKLEHLAQMFAEAEHPLAIPGGNALGQSNGIHIAEAVLALNVLGENLGKPGGVKFNPPAVLGTVRKTATIAEMVELIEKMNAGEVQALFVHGVNPVFELPKQMGFAEALGKVPLVISFSSFPDETALMADYIFPDHTGMEAWGYQQVVTGSSKAVLSGVQPVVVPFYETKSTVDVLLAASQALPYEDEVAFIQSKLSELVGADNALIRAGEIQTFMAQFQQYGGWWGAEDNLGSPASVQISGISAEEGFSHGEGEFFLHPYVSPILAEKGANKPWLQEIPDPTTTVMWNTWVEINPETAEELGIDNNELVKVTSKFGEIEAAVYLYPAIRPDTIAIPFGQGHTAYGRYAEGRGANPLDLLGIATNTAGDLQFGAVKVKITKTGKIKNLARLESIRGVYGESHGE